MRGAEELTCIKKAKLEYGGAHYFNPSAMTGIIKAIPNSAIRCFRIYSNCLFFSSVFDTFFTEGYSRKNVWEGCTPHGIFCCKYKRK